MAATRKTARRATQPADCPLEAELRRCHGIGQLERLAGIGQDHDSRFKFWIAFREIKGFAHIEAGVAELERRIRARYAAGDLVLEAAE